eukprot:TRINITY_DN14605_c0_g2_i2.p1 TRINITY_DN14605_c0_g2~~TRINITY_DN14605_c0_g2_i2.p1  ORF type:complete len:1005 (-),score=208.39 TRINITY_DN14605_c0_g2_i2:58-3072(-)
MTYRPHSASRLTLKGCNGKLQRMPGVLAGVSSAADLRRNMFDTMSQNCSPKAELRPWARQVSPTNDSLLAEAAGGRGLGRPGSACRLTLSEATPNAKHSHSQSDHRSRSGSECELTVSEAPVTKRAACEHHRNIFKKLLKYEGTEKRPSLPEADPEVISSLRDKMLQLTPLVPLDSDLPEKKVKPTEEQRQASRKRTQKRTVTMMSGKSDGDTAMLSPPSTGQVATLVPSVKQCLARFEADGEHLSHEEKVRARIVFQRFTDQDLSRDILHELLWHLGFLTMTPEKADQVAKETTEFSTLDLEDFLDYVERCVMAERTEVQVKLEKFELEKSSRVSISPMQNIQKFMRSLGVICTADAVKATMVIAGLTEGHECDTSEELLRFVGAWRSTEGFTPEEIKELENSFDECEEETKFTRTEASNAGCKLIKADELSNGLLDFVGLYGAGQLRMLDDLLKEADIEDRPPGVCFYEFMICARRLRQAMLKEVYAEFEKLDDDEDGYIAGEELADLCRPTGFSLLKVEVEELMADASIAEDSFLDFDEVWKFVLAVRERNGFTKEEQDELTSHFEKFSDESGEMPNLQVMNLLQWMGFENSLEDVRRMVQEVDFNGNGTMDVGEFLRLMRLQKESNLAGYKGAYEHFRVAEKDLDQLQGCLQECMEYCNLKPPSIVLNQSWACVRESIAEKKELTFEDFTKFAESCRKLIPVESRKYACFKDDQIQDLRQAFSMQDPDGRGHVNLGQLLWMLGDAGMGVNTSLGRAELLEVLEKARESARELGVPDEEVGNPGTPRIRFMPLLHLVRSHVSKHEHARLQQEDIAMRNVKFSSQEVIEFRKLFEQYTKEELENQKIKKEEKAVKLGQSSSDAMPASSLSKVRSALKAAADFEKIDRSNGLSAVINKFTHVPRLPCWRLIRVLNGIGVRARGKQKVELLRQLSQVCDEEETVDFSGFLLTLQWAVDCDFGNINASADRITQSLEVDEKAALLQSQFSHMVTPSVQKRRNSFS